MSGIIGTAGTRNGVIGQLSGREHIATFDGYTNPQTNPAGSTTDGSGLNNVYRSQYEHYIVDIANLGISGDGQQILFRFVNAAGTILTSSDYNYMGYGRYASDAGSGSQTLVDSTEARFELIASCYGAAGQAINGTIKLTGMGKDGAEYATITGNASFPIGGSGEHAQQSLTGVFHSAGDITGFVIYIGTTSTYFNSGQISCYGIRKR